MTYVRKSVLAIALGAAAGIVSAQEATRHNELSPGYQLHQKRFGTDLSTTRDHAMLADAFSAERLLGADVRGSRGDDVGEVRDFIVDASGRISGIVVQSQGFLGIGDIDFVVPWKQVKLSADLSSVTVPVVEDSLPNFSPFNDSKLRIPHDSHRGSELFDSPINLKTGKRFGQVEDLLFGGDGQIRMVVVRPNDDQGHGLYSYPYRPQSADSIYFGKPYELPAVEDLKPFDYAQIGATPQMASRR